jgi:hypothetical protein
MVQILITCVMYVYGYSASDLPSALVAYLLKLIEVFHIVLAIALNYHYTLLTYHILLSMVNSA